MKEYEQASASNKVDDYADKQAIDVLIYCLSRNFEIMAPVLCDSRELTWISKESNEFILFPSREGQRLSCRAERSNDGEPRLIEYIDQAQAA